MCYFREFLQDPVHNSNFLIKKFDHFVQMMVQVHCEKAAIQKIHSG
jgi:hypothetical protein